MTVLATTAQAAPEDDYIVYKTAAAINQACGGLKYVEHSRTLGAAQQALSDTTQYRHSNDGRMTPEEFDAWLATLDARVAQQVQAVGCTQEAMQFIMRGKGVASEGIYKGLALAAHFAGAPATDIMTYMQVEPDRMQALQRYDVYLQAIYRENFAAFAARQKEQAAMELPAVNPFGIDDFGLGLASSFMSTEDIGKLQNAQSIAGIVLDAVFFEVAAESVGFVVRPHLLQDTWTIPELRQAAVPQEPGFVVVDGPGYDLIDFDLTDDDFNVTKVYRALVLKPDNGLRVMFYGDAATRIQDGTVRLYVPNEALPAGARAYEYFESPAFRTRTTAYDGVRVESGCLSAACFDFPPAATDAFVRFQDNQYAELFVSPLPDAQPQETDKIISKQGRMSNFYAYKLLKE